MHKAWLGSNCPFWVSWLANSLSIIIIINIYYTVNVSMYTAVKSKLKNRHKEMLNPRHNCYQQNLRIQSKFKFLLEFHLSCLPHKASKDRPEYNQMSKNWKNATRVLTVETIFNALNCISSWKAITWNTVY
jgi:hypothetical protein